MVTFENGSEPMEKTHEHLTKVHSTYPQPIWSLLEPVKVVLHHFKNKMPMPKLKFLTFLLKTILLSLEPHFSALTYSDCQRILHGVQGHIRYCSVKILFYTSRLKLQKSKNKFAC